MLYVVIYFLYLHIKRNIYTYTSLGVEKAYRIMWIMCAAKAAKEEQVRTWNLEPVWPVALIIVSMISEWHYFSKIF